MIYRVRFAKYGVLKFIGHLDVMRYFQKVIRRSNLPVKYSQGYTPHQILSFALPLGLGITSDGEYMEIEFTDDTLSEKDIFDALAKQTTEGFEILDIMALPPTPPNTHQDSSMALVSAAEYRGALKSGYEAPFNSQEELWEAFLSFYAQESISVNKKTKKSEKEIDVKPYIYLAASDYESMKEGIPVTAGKTGYYTGNELFKCVGNCEFGAQHTEIDVLKHANSFEKEQFIYLRLAAGSVNNIKPELILEAFLEHAGKKYDPNAWEFHRTELFMGEKKLVPMVYKN